MSPTIETFLQSLISFGIEVSEKIYLVEDWLIDWCLTSSEQFFSYIQDENI
jgi:hypothetical protein